MESLLSKELTISEIHEAYRLGTLSCRLLIENYINKLNSLDPSLNIVTYINLDIALQQADTVDLQYKKLRSVPNLYGIPIVVKDNMATINMPTTAGCLGLKGSTTRFDAYIIQKVKAAGAIILFKSNMGEFGFSPLLTNSSLVGIAKNPYDTTRVIPGSSGGSAIAVSCNLVTIGLGTDTGNSIRRPAATCCIVGVRPTLGLVSRSGIVPYSSVFDMPGPLARSVEDASILLHTIAGLDINDASMQNEYTKEQIELFINQNPKEWLIKDALKSTRIGIFAPFTIFDSDNQDISLCFNKAIEDLQINGSSILLPSTSNFESLKKDIKWEEYKYFSDTIDNWILSSTTGSVCTTLQDIQNKALHLSASKHHIERILKAQQSKPVLSSGHIEDIPWAMNMKLAISKLIDDYSLDALVYPSYTVPPRYISEVESEDPLFTNLTYGDNSFTLSSTIGFPCICLPMGYVYRNNSKLPVSISFVGKPFSDAKLISIAYSYEQATMHRYTPSVIV